MNVKILALLVASSVSTVEIAYAMPSSTYRNSDSSFLVM
jgi:hypothetical protein